MPPQPGVDPNTGFPILDTQDLSPVDPYLPPDAVVPGGFIRTPASQLTANPPPRPLDGLAPFGIPAGPGFANPAGAGPNWFQQQDAANRAPGGPQGPPAGGGSGGGGGSGSGGGGGSNTGNAAPDPLEQIRAIYQRQLDDRFDAIRQQFRPLIRGVRSEARQGTREIRQAGRNARGNIEQAQTQLSESNGQIQQLAQERTAGAMAEFQGTPEQAGQMQQLGDFTQGAMDRNAQLSAQQSQGFEDATRLIQQAARSTLVSNRADALTQLRQQRAEQRGLVRDEFNTQMTNLALGSITGAGGGGGGGGGGGWSGGSGSSDGPTEADIRLGAQLGMDPWDVWSQREAGVFDTTFSTFVGGGDPPSQYPYYPEAAAIWLANGGDPSDLTLNDLATIQAHGGLPQAALQPQGPAPAAPPRTGAVGGFIQQHAQQVAANVFGPSRG